MKNIITTALILLMTMSVEARESQNFNNGWLFKKGPFSSSKSVIGTNIMAGAWQEVEIPHTWNAVDMQTAMANMSAFRNPQQRFYTGEAIYKKEFTPLDKQKGKRFFLRFQGVGSVAEVYVNNQFAGNHKGAYSAFTVEISRLLKFNEPNEIIVKVDNSERPDVIPVNNVLFGVYGGIYRDVELIVTNQINIATDDYASPGIYLSQKNVTKKSADIGIKIKIDNKTGQEQPIVIRTTIYEMDGKTVKAKKETHHKLPVQGRQIIDQQIKINSPHLWQGLDDPYLYKVVTQIVSNNQVVDEVIQALGVRHFELRQNQGMFLNGKKVPMYGVCRHQDWWGLGSALTAKEHNTDLEIIREIGATTIRFAHYQQAEQIYAKCDSIGFIVWAEIPFVNQVSTLETDNARQQLTELIRQNYNHPCIYTWGLHNEVYNPAEQVIPLTTALHDLAKTEDPDRYTVSVSGYNTVTHTVNGNADLLGINQYFGWYNGNIGDIGIWLAEIVRNHPNHKVIFSEYGGEANIYQQKEEIGDRGYCCGYDKLYYETFGTKFHEIHWGALEKSNYILGTYIWNTFDFATPLSSQGGIHSRNSKGLVTFDRQLKKDPFYWYKANWSKEPVLYLTQRRAINRANEVTDVTVYSNIGTPTLTVNGKAIQTHAQGETKVHYIFKHVKLQLGENIIEVRGTKEGKAYADKIIWNYSPEFKDGVDTVEPELRTKEHVGL